jgi:hypothetical protein
LYICTIFYLSLIIRNSPKILLKNERGKRERKRKQKKKSKNKKKAKENEMKNKRSKGITK